MKAPSDFILLGQRCSALHPLGQARAPTGLHGRGKPVGGQRRGGKAVEGRAAPRASSPSLHCFSRCPKLRQERGRRPRRDHEWSRKRGQEGGGESRSRGAEASGARLSRAGGRGRGPPAFPAPLEHHSGPPGLVPSLPAAGPRRSSGPTQHLRDCPRKASLQVSPSQAAAVPTPAPLSPQQ